MNEPVVAEEKSLPPDYRSVVRVASQQTERDGADAELDVPHPDAYVAALQYLLEVDSRESG